MKFIHKLLKSDICGGVLLILATILALFFHNIGVLSNFYDEILRSEIIIGFRGHDLAKPLLTWVNDGLMVIFFFSVGLELKKEVLEGALKEKSQIALPTIGALGGVMMPAIIFYLFNHSDEFALRGWAIPTATDIAFALGILVLLGKKVPSGLKVFLLTLAVIDDLCAIIIIAVFYTTKLSFLSMALAGLFLLILAFMNYMKVSKRSMYFFVTALLWLSVLNSGVHATLAGVLAAFCIPMTDKNGNRFLDKLYSDLQGSITYFILPIFAFVNAGVTLKGIEPSAFINSASLGIFFGLLIGKQLGIFLFSFIFIKLSGTKLPQNSNWKQFYGVCILGGIGFTMSLFVDSLAYHDSAAFFHADKLAILLGSLVSGLLGYFYLAYYAKKHPQIEENK